MTTATKPLPPHGARPRYLRGCRCTPCRAANKRYCKQYRLKTFHQPVRVDATPVRERLLQWTDLGYSQSQIGAAVGKNSGEISKILHGQPTIAPGIAARVLRSSGPTGIPANATTDSTGTIRRAQALHAIGYPIYSIAQGVPMAANHLGRLLTRKPPMVSVGIARGMTALYRQLSRRPGPSHLAILDARRRNFFSPLAWDDIDDPACQPDTSAPYQAAPKYERDPDRKYEIEHLYLLGESPEQIAKRLHGNEKYIRDQLGAILRERADRRPSTPDVKEAA